MVDFSSESVGGNLSDSVDSGFDNKQATSFLKPNQQKSAPAFGKTQLMQPANRLFAQTQSSNQLNAANQQALQAIGINSRIKYFPWADWQEWMALHAKIIKLPTFSETCTLSPEDQTLISECLQTITLWLSKNASVISSAKNASPHSKYLKMQRIILEELKDLGPSRVTKAELLASNLRLI